MSIKALATSRLAGSVQRPFEWILVPINLVVLAKQSGGSDVANTDTEIEEGSGELGNVSKEENSSGAKSSEDYR